VVPLFLKLIRDESDLRGFIFQQLVKLVAIMKVRAYPLGVLYPILLLLTILSAAPDGGVLAAAVPRYTGELDLVVPRGGHQPRRGARHHPARRVQGFQPISHPPLFFSYTIAITVDFPPFTDVFARTTLDN
jgi:hypothetical protein